jgi:hypothetical protein
MDTLDRELVLEMVRAVFPDTDAEAVMKTLDEYGTESHEQGRRRVQLGILKLSEGDLEKLAYWIDIAKRDYRDILAWAEYPGEMHTDPAAMDSMTHEEVERIRTADRRQYLEWLKRK